MSNYTMELRHICEHYAGLSPEEIMFANPDEIIAAARPHVFDFQYPLYDPDHKEELETKILYHYYMREIGAETPGLWKLYLTRTMREIMPYYNELYHSAALEYDPLIDVDIRKTHEGAGSGSSTESGQRAGTTGNTRTEARTGNDTVNTTGSSTSSGTSTKSGSSSSETDTTGSSTGSGTTSKSGSSSSETDTTGSSTGSGTSSKTTTSSMESDTRDSSTGSKTSSSQYSDTEIQRNAYSDTPESSIEGVEGDGTGSGQNNVSDNYWLTDYRKISTNKSGSSSGSENTTGSATGHSESTGSQTESGQTGDTRSDTGHSETAGSASETGTSSDTRSDTGHSETAGTTSENGTTNDTRSDTGRSVTDRTDNATITDAGSSSETNSGNSSYMNNDSYVDTIKGKQGAATYASMILEYRETILNIDMMIIEALEPCFMNIY